MRERERERNRGLKWEEKRIKYRNGRAVLFK